MDVLSDMLDSLEMQGRLYYCTAFGEPWSIEMPAAGKSCRFHVMVHGPCRVTVPETGDVAELSKGDLVLIPHGRGHWLQSDAEEPLTPLPEVLEDGTLTEDGCLHWGGVGPKTRMVCGYFDFEAEEEHPLLSSLPGLISVKATASYDFGWIENLTRFISQEAGSGNPGWDAISRRLSEILFIQVIRHYAETAPEAVPVLSAVVHPNVGKALEAMHESPGKPWTVETLAQEAMLSRTAFAETFRELTRIPPIEYLTRLRMERARKLLRGDESTAAVGEAVGYQSEAAFHRAFKRAYGVGPGAYRREL